MSLVAVTPRVLLGSQQPSLCKKVGDSLPSLAHRNPNKAIEPPPNPEDHKDNNAPSAEVNNTAAVTKRIEDIDLTD
ncbi:hypothetical protein PENPOL_c001G08366 [Penicillium polonicum]|uniref:Uncharacterized protein n=1 Tax=Penicillium polonicum TaxID=60169 RepID=A0A1V6P1P7_PENPO|nr:hypothetical protein PENPOL_c001G08366 [Penicillium polonicum]